MTDDSEIPPAESEGPPSRFQRLAPHADGRPRTVLVLGGGGMRGMAHIGVLRALRKVGVQFDAVVGTSIGALIGSMAAAGMGQEEIEPLLGELKKDDYFRLNTMRLLLKGPRVTSMYQGDIFRKSLDRILPKQTFAELEKPFFCNSVRLESGGNVFWGTPGFTDLSMVDAVYASCALPAVFEPFQYGGDHYMDGGIVDALPLRFAKALDADLIIAIDLTIKSTYKAPNYKKRAISTLFRSFEIVQEVLMEHQLHMHVDDRVVLIQPKVGHLHRFDFEQVPSVIQEGEDATLKVLTSHPATRDLVRGDIEGLTCPAASGDYVSLHIDPTACIGCGLCDIVCETDGYFWDQGKAIVRKLRNYECTRDHACARNSTLR